jgi:hypothetical protein
MQNLKEKTNTQNPDIYANLKKLTQMGILALKKRILWGGKEDV